MFIFLLIILSLGLLFIIAPAILAAYGVRHRPFRTLLKEAITMWRKGPPIWSEARDELAEEMRELHESLVGLPSGIGVLVGATACTLLFFPFLIEKMPGLIGDPRGVDPSGFYTAGWMLISIGIAVVSMSLGVPVGVIVSLCVFLVAFVAMKSALWFVKLFRHCCKHSVSAEEIL